MKKTYKNISKKDLTIPNIGVVKSGETFEIEGDVTIANRNFKEVKKDSDHTHDVETKNFKIKNNL